MQNFKLIIEYDGTGYCGWQRQKHEPSIQATVEAALATMLKRPVSLIGSGRTDAGVHALGQTANFRCDARIGADAFQRGLNSLLPADIVIRKCTPAPDGFHARYDAVGKRYHYRILNRTVPSALMHRYAWHVRRPLDADAMQRGARHLLGEHDFKAFEGAGSPRSHTIRRMTHAAIVSGEAETLVFQIEGSGFLRFMVRNIVSTLVNVGLGRIAPDAIRSILRSKDRSQAGPTAPAKGLCLMWVTYGDSAEPRPTADNPAGFAPGSRPLARTGGKI